MGLPSVRTHTHKLTAANGNQARAPFRNHQLANKLEKDQSRRALENQRNADG
jgi:hypothetical protein